MVRNIHKRRGAQVTLEEIAKCAKPACKKCNGTGVILQRLTGSKPEEPPTQIGCGCAAKRFVEAHPEVIVSEQNYAWWPAPDSEQPAPKAAPPLAGLNDEDEDDKATTPDRRAAQLVRLIKLRADAQIELSDVEKEIEAAKAPHLDTIGNLNAKVQEHDIKLAELGNESRLVAAEVVSIDEQMVKLHARRHFLMGETAVQLTQRQEVLAKAIAVIRDDRDKATDAAHQAAHKLRRKALPLANRVQQLTKRIARIQAYQGTTTVEAGNPTAPA